MALYPFLTYFTLTSCSSSGLPRFCSCSLVPSAPALASCIPLLLPLGLAAVYYLRRGISCESKAQRYLVLFLLSTLVTTHSSIPQLIFRVSSRTLMPGVGAGPATTAILSPAPGSASREATGGSGAGEGPFSFCLCWHAGMSYPGPACRSCLYLAPSGLAPSGQGFYKDRCRLAERGTWFEAWGSRRNASVHPGAARSHLRVAPHRVPKFRYRERPRRERAGKPPPRA